MSPVMTAFELKPSRVTNIFICSEVVFCASSMMTNECSSATAHKGNTRNLDDVLFKIAIHLLGIEHVIKRVIQLPQVGGSILSCKVPGSKR